MVFLEEEVVTLFQLAVIVLEVDWEVVVGDCQINQWIQDKENNKNNQNQNKTK